MEIGWHLIIISIIVGAVIILQILIFNSTLKRIKLFKKIFPDERSKYELSTTKEEKENEIKEINAEHNNKVLTSIFFSINNYLDKNRAAVSNFNLIKDIVDRNCDAEEEEIHTQIPMPLYMGLVGTMAGILIGVLFLIWSGDLKILLGGKGEVGEAQGIVVLLSGVGLAMFSSILGLGMTSWTSYKMKESKANVEKNKNVFFDWIQAELMPGLNSSTTDTLEFLTRNLNQFNKSFQTNTQELKSTLDSINTSYKEQAYLMETVNKLDISNIATANVRVLKELKDCTEEINQFNDYLHKVNHYIERVQVLNEKLNQHLDRTKVIEDMGEFFKKELEQIESRKGVINQSVGSIDDALRKTIQNLKENTESHFNSLSTTSIKLHQQFQKVLEDQQNVLKEKFEDTSINSIELHRSFGKAIEEQQNTFHKKLGENSNLLEELKNLTKVKSAINNLEQFTLVQNEKLDKLIEVIENQNFPEIGTISIPEKMMFPKWIKITGIVGFGIICFTCIYFIIMHVLTFLGVMV